MRYDVYRKAGNALKIANIEVVFGIKSTYFFGIVKQSNQPEIIKEIVKLGHEIGYH